MDDVRARTGTSKSQLFHYFPDGKDQLLLAVAQYEADRVLDDQQPYLGCLDSWDAWYRWRDVVVRRYEEQGDHCPLGSLFLQIGRSTPGARAIVVELMRQWQASLAQGVRALQAGGRLPGSFDADQAAAALLAGIQGGVSIMLSTGSPLTCGRHSTGASPGCGRPPPPPIEVTGGRSREAQSRRSSSRARWSETSGAAMISNCLTAPGSETSR
ncbi:TetR/AcrR family transcriptional regulator [Nonomuraea antimicrobica]